MKYVLVLMLSLLLAPAPVFSQGKSFTEGDLEILLNEKNYKGVVDRLGDIAPSKRSSKWNDIVVKASTGRLLQLKEMDECMEGYSLSLSLLENHPKLKENREFLDARRDVSICAMKKTSWGGPSANDIMKSIAKFDPSEETLYVLASNKTHSSPSYYLDLLEKNPGKYSKDKNVQDYLLSNLSSDPQRDEAKNARDLIAKHMFTQTQDKLREYMLTPDKDHLRINAYMLMKEKGKISKEDETYYHFLNFMDGFATSPEEKHMSFAYLEKAPAKDIQPAVKKFISGDQISVNCFERKASDDKYDQKRVEKLLGDKMPELVANMGKRCVGDTFPGCGYFYEYFAGSKLISESDKEKYFKNYLSDVVASGQYDPWDKRLEHALVRESKVPMKDKKESLYMKFAGLLDKDIEKIQNRINYDSPYDDQRSLNGKLKAMENLRDNVVKKHLP